MRIALLTMGTRGDVQPYAVLGRALKDRGHQVTLSTAKNFEPLVKSYDLDFAPVDADFQSFLETDEGKRMMKNPFRAKKHLRTWVYPMIEQSLKTFYTLARESDKVLFHVKTMADVFADQFPEKMMRANVVPALEPTKEFPNPVASAFPLPGFLNKFTYNLSALGLKMMNTPVQVFRREAGLPAKVKQFQLPSIYGISSHFLKRPDDYPDSSVFTGFWQKLTNETLDRDLLKFLRSGAPPVLLTFGSMPFNSRIDLKAAIARLTHELEIRVVVVKGWGLSNTEDLEENPSIKVVTSAPYDQLLPWVKAVVHHGGIGTTAACLQAGKPFFCCPVLYPLGDQHFWGTVAYRKGLALKPVPLKKMTADMLLLKVRELLSSEELYRNSTQMSHLLQSEDGLRNAVQIIEQGI